MIYFLVILFLFLQWVKSVLQWFQGYIHRSDNQAMIKKIASDWFHFVVESKKEIAMEVKSQEERNATLEQVAANLRTKSWIQNQQQ